MCDKLIGINPQDVRGEAQCIPDQAQARAVIDRGSQPVILQELLDPVCGQLGVHESDGGQGLRLSGEGAREAFAEYLGLRLKQPHFANARSVRNALDRARLRQASRLFADRDRVLSAEDLTTLLPQDIRASRVFQAAGG